MASDLEARLDAHVALLRRIIDPNPDGDDFEPLGKYHHYRFLMQRIRKDPNISEEAKLRQINYMKEVLLPFWHRAAELDKREQDELRAVFLKYNGPEGLRVPFEKEYDEIKANIEASDDKILLSDLRFAQVLIGPQSDRIFYYDNDERIFYSSMDTKHSTKVDGSSVEIPAINHVPLGADGLPYHHNINPDDDLSLNPMLLQLLHRLMDHKEAGPFINFDDDKRPPKYYFSVTKPRCFKFIEQGLKLDPSIGYGATAFFNDLLLLFRNPTRVNFPPDKILFQAIDLEYYMKRLLGEMGSVGEKLLALFNAIEKLRYDGEPWADPEVYYLQEPHHPRRPRYDGSAPSMDFIKAMAWTQFKFGQERVKELRSILGSAASNAQQGDHNPSPAGSAPLNHELDKQPHEQGAEPIETSPNQEPDSQQSVGIASPGPSDPNTAPVGRAASKRPREAAEDDGGDSNVQEEKSRTPKRIKLNLRKTTASSSAQATASGAPTSNAQIAPPQASSSKRARTPDDVDGDDDDQGDVDGQEPSRSKRRRLVKGKQRASLPAASPEPGPSNTGKAASEPAGAASGSSQAHASSSSAAAQPAPQPQYPAHYEAPSSQPLNFSRTTIDMAKIVRRGKERPWAFGYSTDEGYGIYAFVKCPRQGCKHRFSSHPLKDNRARDHLLSCNQPIVDEQDMVRQYASQVVKTAGRKSDLTVDWARKSNQALLPTNEKNNHPDNFPLSPADE